ncbi:hypothetical protein J437_LFUL015714 [Ladona fulva]|uniref:Uncharacterized protein n=1 Tax=Ladona fulva TaxID=123851 RepID=A0A8K0P670_LADFU|nr:hypothetical protein J437_LFUL015714 [Ladona fulva]
MPKKKESVRRIEQEGAHKAAGLKRIANKYAAATETTENTSLLIDFGQDSENTPEHEDGWVFFKEDDDIDPKKRRASKSEKYFEDEWEESFYHNADLLGLS